MKGKGAIAPATKPRAKEGYGSYSQPNRTAVSLHPTHHNALPTPNAGLRLGELNGVPVQIHPKARLAGMDVGSRLDVILEPVGEEAAGALLLELSG
mmetsp:Transcript_35626/g.61569  ORF Transcript_35626/g.61569 Transcript_35626/m.61569 type:complete len:96 (+) Transcript_35626:20-307(+)